MGQITRWRGETGSPSSTENRELPRRVWPFAMDLKQRRERADAWERAGARRQLDVNRP
jgi:hypothetical protein